MNKSIILSVLFLSSFTTFAEPSPKLIPFQGRLTDQSGVAYTNGQFTILFQLYNDAVGGTAIWTERHEKVGVVNGTVNVFLGSINSLDAVTFDQTKHLGITVDADNNPNTPDPEMVPRQMIIPAFWAKNSEKLNGYDWSAILVNGANNPVSGKILGSKIQDQGITASQIAIGTINSGLISSGAITSNLLAPGAVTGNSIAAGSISSLQISSNSITVESLALRPIVTNGAVVPPGGIGVSPSSGRFMSPTPGSLVVVSNFSLTIVTRGNPVEVVLVPDGNTNFTSYFNANRSNASAFVMADLLRNGVRVATTDFQGSGSVFGVDVPPGCFRYLDFPPVGTNLYQIAIRGDATTTVLAAYNMQMVIREL